MFVGIIFKHYSDKQDELMSVSIHNDKSLLEKELKDYCSIKNTDLVIIGLNCRYYYKILLNKEVESLK